MAHWSQVLRPLCSTGYSALMIRPHLKDDEPDKRRRGRLPSSAITTINRGAIQGQQVVDRKKRER